MSLRKSGNIGVVIPYLPKDHLLSTHYFSEILSGIGSKLGANNYNLLLMFQSPHEHIDYALVGYDDSDITSITNPQVTSLKVPFLKIR